MAKKKYKGGNYSGATRKLVARAISKANKGSYGATGSPPAGLRRPAGSNRSGTKASKSHSGRKGLRGY